MKLRLKLVYTGDTKLYTDVPVLTPVDWVQDSADAVNLLALNRPAAPKTQALTIDVFKQVRLTKDSYLSKQAFGTEGAFVSYQSVLDSRLTKSKQTYLNKTYNTFIGTTKGYDSTNTEVKLDINAAEKPGISMGEAIAYKMSNLIDDMKDYSTKYTKNGFERAFADGDIKIIWNNKYVNAVKKIDLPSIFHDDALQASFVGEKLPARYFGAPNNHTTSVAGDRATHDLAFDANNAKITKARIKDESADAIKVKTYVAAGDEIPAGLTIEAGDAYTVNDKIICKVFTKLPPVLEAFSVSSDFWNR